jgi:MFS family permease
MVNVKRIFYVTSHFHALKGLMCVPWGIYYLAGGIFAVEQPPFNDMTETAMLFGGLFLATIAQVLLARYYQRTLGVVGEPLQKPRLSTDPATRRWRIWLWSGFVAASVLIGLLAIWGTPLLDPHYASMFIYRLLCAIVICLLGLTLWLQERVEEGYGHIPLWPLAAYLILTLEPPAFWRTGATILLENILIGLFFICGGVYNHLLLTRSFQKYERVISYVKCI